LDTLTATFDIENQCFNIYTEIAFTLTEDSAYAGEQHERRVRFCSIDGGRNGKHAVPPRIFSINAENQSEKPYADRR
jgi:hypothetical protein